MVRCLLSLCLLYSGIVHAAAGPNPVKALEVREKEERQREFEDMAYGLFGIDVKSARQVNKADIVKIYRKDRDGFEGYEATLKNGDLIVAASSPTYGTQAQRYTCSPVFNDKKFPVTLSPGVFGMLKDSCEGQFNG